MENNRIAKKKVWDKRSKEDIDSIKKQKKKTMRQSREKKTFEEKQLNLAQKQDAMAKSRAKKTEKGKHIRRE